MEAEDARWLERARVALRENFGFDDFRPGQAEAIAPVLRGEDVVALYPTGAGKSLIFQLPALMRPGAALVVSPLIALMRDQVEKLRRFGIKAGALYAGQSGAERRALARELADGALKLLYLAPERLVLPETLDDLRGARINLLAVDEAHCVSQWGHDFRPDYLNIRNFAERLGAPQLLALTATAAPTTRADMIAHLFDRPPRIVAASLRRPNLQLSARPRQGDGFGQIRDFVAAHPGQSGIVYCASRTATEALAAFLREAGLSAQAYHAGLPVEERARRQDEFVARSDLAMTATIAFGLGVDKPDLRYVLHRDPPHRLESLYQESGRAGRDGLPAEALALYIDRAPRLDDVDGCAGYFFSLECRERKLLAHFGEQTERCGQCDNCRRNAAAAFFLRASHALRRVPTKLSDWLDRHVASGAETTPGVAPVGAPMAAPASEVELTILERRRLDRLRGLRQKCARRVGLAPARLAPDSHLLRWSREFWRDRVAFDDDFAVLAAAQQGGARKTLEQAREIFWQALDDDASLDTARIFGASADDCLRNEKAFRE